MKRIVAGSRSRFFCSSTAPAAIQMLLRASVIGVSLAVAFTASDSFAAPPREESIASEMVDVPGGSFLMGCNESVDTECVPDEKPGRTVQAAAFKIDRTEVTVEQYARCVAAGKCSSKGLLVPHYNGADQPELRRMCNWKKQGRERHPINCLDWKQAESFCAWRGARLPTQVEWERAARGTDGRRYPWGNATYGTSGPVANIADESFKSLAAKMVIASGYDDGYEATAPVGSFPKGAAPCGALDMIGNVWEWTADGGPNAKAIRGASWDSVPKIARVSLMANIPNDYRSPATGFRCAVLSEVNSPDATPDAKGPCYSDMVSKATAIEECSKLIRHNPKQAGPYRSRGVAYMATGDYDRAIADLTKAIALDPESHWSYWNRCSAHGSKGDHERAIADCTKSIEMDPTDANPYYNRGNSYLRQGNFDRAIVDYGKVVEIDPKSWAAYTNRGTAYLNNGDYEHAVADYAKAIELNPDSAQAYNNRAFAYFKSGKADLALTDANKSLELRSNDGVLQLRGLILEALGKRDEAIADFRSVLSRTSAANAKESADALQRLGANP